MAKFEKIDAEELRRSLSSLRAAEGFIPDPERARVLVAERVEAFLFRLHENVPGARPNLSIFKALASSPADLWKACAKTNPKLIECSVADSHRVSKKWVQRDWERYTPLQTCARHDLWREASILLAYGANPNLFNAGVTAVGLAAYCGSARTLCQMLGFGANATLYLRPEHAPLDTNAHGSTLLHRVASRSIVRNKPAVIRVLADCERCYPDPLPKTLSGATPLDWARSEDDEETCQQILFAAARHERHNLSCGIPAAPERPATSMRM